MEITNHKEMIVLDVFQEARERYMITRNNYRKYHNLPMLRGEVKHKKRFLTITLRKYIGSTGTGKSFYKTVIEKVE